jgi:hypothetical protein
MVHFRAAEGGTGAVGVDGRSAKELAKAWFPTAGRLSAPEESRQFQESLIRGAKRRRLRIPLYCKSDSCNLQARNNGMKSDIADSADVLLLKLQIGQRRLETAQHLTAERTWKKHVGLLNPDAELSEVKGFQEALDRVIRLTDQYCAALEK